MSQYFKIIICYSLLSASCVSISRSDEQTLRELNSYGIRSTEIQKKNPGAAGALNILPGFGNFYLAYDTDESSQWAFGFLNLLVWPLSIIWSVPEAAIDATTINKKETVYYYTYDNKAKAELKKMQLDNAEVEYASKD